MPQAVIQVCTFAVNYVGHPFNTSIRENRGLYSGLYYMTIFLTVVTFEVVPGGWYYLSSASYCVLVFVCSNVRATVVSASWHSLGSHLEYDTAW